MKSRIIHVTRINGLSANPSWDELEAVVSILPPLPFLQTWRLDVDACFQMAELRVFRMAQTLAFFAQFHDAHPGNPSRGLNQCHFLKGDVFEIFLRPPGQDSYYELHVTPEGETYQVCIPSSEELYRQRGLNRPIEDWVRPWLLRPPLAKCMARLRSERPGWDSAILFPISGRPNGTWTFSACRYDYPPNGGSPVLSSVSPLTRRDFHRQEDWLKFCLTDG